MVLNLERFWNTPYNYMLPLAPMEQCSFNNGKTIKNTKKIEKMRTPTPLPSGTRRHLRMESLLDLRRFTERGAGCLAENNQIMHLKTHLGYLGGETLGVASWVARRGVTAQEGGTPCAAFSAAGAAEM